MWVIIAPCSALKISSPLPATTSRGAVQQGLFVARGTLDFFKLGLATDKHYSLEVILENPEVDSLKQIEEIAEDLLNKAISEKPDRHAYISPILFRGQARASWRLETTLERYGRSSLEFDEYIRYLSKVKPAIESVLGRAFSFNWNNPEEKSTKFVLSNLKLREGQYEFMVYLRHHGFPTPLLDWSRSLYVALFFALSDQPTDENCALYMYIEHLGNGKGGVVGSPEIATMGQYVAVHKRHWIQQSDYTACVAKTNDTWHFHPHEKAFDDSGDQSDRLVKVLIKPALRIQLLRQLDLMNVNAFSLFSTEEALMKTLAFREMPDDEH
jgi:FRG domain